MGSAGDGFAVGIFIDGTNDGAYDGAYEGMKIVGGQVGRCFLFPLLVGIALDGATVGFVGRNEMRLFNDGMEVGFKEGKLVGQVVG